MAPPSTFYNSGASVSAVGLLENYTSTSQLGGTFSSQQQKLFTHAHFVGVLERDSIALYDILSQS